MRKNLYVVSTYYHCLIACVKQLVYKQESDIVVTAYIPKGDDLARKIKESSIFEKVSFIGEVQEYQPVNLLDTLLNLHRKNALMIEKQMDFDFSVYDNIYLFHDDIWVAHYLNNKRINYHLIEDALDSFKYISKSKFKYMLPGNKLKMLIKKWFHIGYVFCGYDKYTLSIEVNEIKGTEIERFAKCKMIELPREDLFQQLSSDNLALLKKVFLKEVPDFNAECSVLLLTQPLYIDGIVPDEKTQIEQYINLVSENVSEEDVLVIKPHPRDMTDYTATFPNAIILNKDMPVEILQMGNGCKFKKILTFFSTACAFLNADSKVEIYNEREVL